MRKKYNSLTQFKSEIEREGKCEILEFNGAFLTVKCGSKKIRYGLYDGVISETIIFEDKN